MKEEAILPINSPTSASAGVPKVMFKEKQKNYTWCQRNYLTMKTATRYVALVVMLMVISYLSFNYMNMSSIVKLSQDRSEAYNVKILPASLNDEDLDKLAKDTFSYLAMIDAGSSGCRAHVYRYGKLGTITGPLYVLPKHDSLKVKPGLSSFANNPQDAGMSLQGLIDFMKEQVPEKDWAVTPIWLKATAGLRMLDTAKSDAILSSVRSFLLDTNKSPFLFRASWAKIIPGNEEGGFGWIAFNYLKRIIGPKRHPQSLETPYAVVEMGGASAQVSQVAPNPAAAAAIPMPYRFTFTIEQDTYQLYTHSYLGFGAEQAREQLNVALKDQASAGEITSTPTTVKDPCLNNGYTRSATEPVTEPYQGPGGVAAAGASNAPDAGVCALSVRKLFDQIYSGAQATAAAVANLRSAIAAAATKPPGSSDQAPVCNPETHPAPHSFGCVHQPDFVTASSNFLVFENFYYMSSAIAVKPITSNSSSTSATTSFPLRTTASHILEAANQVCTVDTTALNTYYPVDKQSKDVSLKMCFLGSYSYAFLVDGLRVPKDKVLTIQKEVGQSEIEWALGAAYKEAADLLKRTNLRPT